MSMNEWIVSYYTVMGWPIEPELFKNAALDGFKRDYKSERDRLWGLKKLRGADNDEALKQIIKNIENTLQDANTQAEAATDIGGVEAARQKLKDIKAKAQNAEAAAKELETGFSDDLKAMPEYQEALATVRQERDIIAALPGAASQLAKMQELLANGEAQIQRQGGVSTGYKNALAKLTDHADILKQAREASDAYLKKEIPQEVQAAWTSAKTKVEAYRRVGPEFQAKLYEKDLADVLESGRQDKDKAVADLAQISITVENEVRAQNALRDTGQKDLATVAQLLEKLVQAGVPASNYAQAQQQILQAKDLMADTEREYQSAIDLLEESQKLCDSILAADQAGGKSWAAKAKQLNEIKANCLRWKQWTPLRSRAEMLLDGASSLEATVSESRDYIAASQWLAELTKQADALDAEAAKSGMPKDLDQFAADCKKARDEVDAAREEVLGALSRLEEKLKEKGVENLRNTNFHKRLRRRYDQDWIQFVGTPTSETVTDLNKRKKATIGELRGIITEIQAVLKKKDELDRVVKGAKYEDEKQANAARPKKIESLFKDLENFKVDTKSERAKFDQNSGDQAELRTLEKDLESKLAEARKAHEEKQQKARETIKGINKNLDYFEGLSPDFAPYIKTLKAQADDLKSLVDSGDPYLFELASKNSDDLVKKMKAIDPKTRPETAKTFGDVEKKWSAMSKELGKDNLVKDRLPDTFELIYDDLQTAIAAARESDPETGLKSLQPLEQRIQAACAKAATEDLSYKAFKAQKTALEARWKEITKLTKTWITERTTAYEAKFKTLVGEATKSSKEEGKIEEARQKLTKIKDELEKIENAPSPRQALQEQDALAGREQKLVEDMAKQFEAAVETYEKTTLSSLRKALKGIKGADMDQLDSLEKVPKHATRTVEPYLSIISKLPHKRLPANAAPPMDKAKEDFALANKMLTDATRTAKWLVEHPEGTNVKFTGDLERVSEDWIKFTNAYTAAVQKLAKAIAAAGEGEADQKLKLQSETVATVLKTGAPKFFKAQAFAKPVGMLVKPNGSAADAKDENARLAAREAALRTIRRYRRELLTDPLLVRINDRNNPFESVSRQAGLVRATLKRLELELLGSV